MSIKTRVVTSRKKLVAGYRRSKISFIDEYLLNRNIVWIRMEVLNLTRIKCADGVTSKMLQVAVVVATTVANPITRSTAATAPTM